MPFRFRFETLLQQRQHRFQEAQIALAAAQRRHTELQARCTSMRERIQEQWQTWEVRQREGMDATSYLTFRYYIAHLEQQLLILEREVEKAALEEDRRKQEMLERDRELKILEQLKESERAAYRIQQTRLEQKHLDEIAVLKNARERMGVESD